MSTQLNTLKSVVLSAAPSFNEVLVDKSLHFEAEAGFALQRLQENPFLAQTALGNKPSLLAAIQNIAAIGISLNPAARQAYLVPRDSRVCLDISYMGMMHLAQQTGAIQWGQAILVRQADQFTLTGIDAAPVHQYSPFADEDTRGEVVGAYVVIKTETGDYLTHCMPTRDIYAIRDRSSAWKAWISKKRTCPWMTDEGEMMKKTVVKQASKYWPHRDRLRHAIQHMDTEGGEGIELSQPHEHDVTPSDAGQQQHLANLLTQYGRTWTDLAPYIGGGTYVDRPMAELSQEHAAAAIKLVERRLKGKP